MSSRFVFRIIAPTMAVSLGLLCVGGLAAWYLHLLQKRSSALLTDTVERVRAAEELDIVGRELQIQFTQLLLLDNPQGFDEVSRLRGDMNRWIAVAQQISTTDPQKRLIRKIAEGYKRFFTEFDRLAQSSRKSGGHNDVVELKLVHDLVDTRILQPAHEYRKLNRELMERASERNQAIADRMGLGLLLLGMCGAVSGLLVGYGIARGIHRSIVELSVPIRDATGKLSQLVGPITVSSDVGLEELESALQSMSGQIGIVLERFQENERAALRTQQLAAMGQLAAGLAHELLNPLTAMKILVQQTDECGGPVQLDNDDLVVFREEIERMEHTIRTFLDYARPPHLQTQRLVLRHLIRQTVEFVTPRAQRLGVQLRCLTPDPVVEVEVDAGQIRQVLLNLLLNALDASSSGQTVTIRISQQAPSNGTGDPHVRGSQPQWIVVEVMDQGSGLPTAMEDRIFEPFVSTKEEGAGLGLPICKRIVEEHGGQITADNGQESGAVFTVKLPVTATDENAAGASLGSSRE